MKNTVEIKRWICIICGCLAVAFGVVGIFVPGLPTTPFLLLASWLFYNSSDRMHAWLNRCWLGGYIRRYHERQGMSKRGKLFAILCMWIMISVSAFCVFETWTPRVILFILGAVGTTVVLFVVPNACK